MLAREESYMKMNDFLLLLSLGLLIWILGTVYYAYAGSRALETTPARYWVNFAASPLFSAVLCIAMAPRRTVQLGCRRAPSRHTRNDRRSGRALEPENLHASDSRSIRRPLRCSPLRHLRCRSHHRRIRH